MPAFPGGVPAGACRKGNTPMSRRAGGGSSGSQATAQRRLDHLFVRPRRARNHEARVSGRSPASIKLTRQIRLRDRPACKSPSCLRARRPPSSSAEDCPCTAAPSERRAPNPPAIGQRYARGCGRPARGSHAGHDRERHTSGVKRIHLFAGTAEDRAVASFEPHDGLARRPVSHTDAG